MSNSSSTTIATRWGILTAAPHRMFFASGLAWLLAWSAWWVLLLAARSFGSYLLEPAVPALLLHAGIMLYLVLPPFMYGFLLTVFPRWMPAPQPGRSAMVAAFVLLNLGNLLALVGLLAGTGWLLAGWLAATLGLAVITAVLGHILWRARGRASHAFATLAGLVSGLLGMGLFALSLAQGDWASWPLLRGLGLWAFLLVVYFGVCHRMVPFFTSRVVPDYVSWRPDWVLLLFVLLAVARALLELAPALAWLASVPLAVLTVICVLRWRPTRRSGVPLLDVLHWSLAWLAIGVTLAAVADLAAALGAPGLVGRAPLHALGMGFFGGMLVAMVTRVTLGHSGRPLVLDAVDWRLFLLVQVATVLRLLAEFMPAFGALLGLAAGLAWLTAFVTWAIRLWPVYLRPRVDGVPG